MTDPAVIQVLQAMQNSNQQFAQALGGQQQQLQEQREQSAAQLQRLEAMVENLNQRGHGGVVDVLQVGKPDFLKGTKDQIAKDWTDWVYTFETWFCSQFKDAAEALK